MGELDGIIAVWKREFKVFQREISRIVGSIVSPLLWFIIFGAGLSGSVSLVSGHSYQSYIFPGILMMAVLFTSTFYGVYIIWDKKIDVLKAVLVAPVSRISIFFGKVLGGCTDSIIQAIVLLLIGFVFVGYTVGGFLLVVVFIILTAISFVALGLTIGSLFDSLEGFQLVGTFLVFPLFFLSGALFPLNDSIPGWLLVAAKFNPLTYAVDGARFAILGQSTFPVILDFAVIGGFALLMVILGSVAFSRMK